MDPNRLQQLREQLSPSAGVQNHVWKKVEKNMRAARMLSESREKLTPNNSNQKAVWAGIASRIRAPKAEGILSSLHSSLTPPVALMEQLRRHILARLQPAPAPAFSHARGAKWVAAFALIALFVQMSPRIFLAPRTSAVSVATILPVEGQVEVSIGSLWQPLTKETVLEEGMHLRTIQGKATLLLRDDARMRLAPNTEVIIHDTSDRLEPAPEVLPTLTLVKGRLWVHGLVPSYLRGVAVSVPSGGLVSVHEGSVDISVSDSLTEVTAWDRRTLATYEGKDTVLVAGERMQFSAGVTPEVREVASREFLQDYARTNLEYDAVHRREIAHMQQERRAAQAGILPTSRLYAMKRIAEQMDVFMTVGEEAKIEKKLQHAETRLNEASALLADKQPEEAKAPLEEYQSALLEVATGSGEGSLAQFMVRQSIMETSAEVAAAAPADDTYLIKKTVLEATAALPEDVGVGGDVRSVLLLDHLNALHQEVKEGNAGTATLVLADITPSLAALEKNSGLSEDVREEALSLLKNVSEDLQESTVAMEGKEDFLQEVASILPQQPDQVELPSRRVPARAADSKPLTDEEVAAAVQGIRKRIFNYDLKNSRVNQFTQELRALEGTPDQGRILRQIYRTLPDGPEEFPERVRKEIIRIGTQRQLENQ